MFPSPASAERGRPAELIRLQRVARRWSVLMEERPRSLGDVAPAAFFAAKIDILKPR